MRTLMVPLPFICTRRTKVVVTVSWQETRVCEATLQPCNFDLTLSIPTSTVGSTQRNQ